MKSILKNEKSRWLMGLSGQNILYALVSSCFAYYLQFTVLIPAFWLGIILSTAKIFDAIKDPFIGAYINKSKWSLPKYLYYLPIPTAIITVLCFTMKIYSPENSSAENAFIIIYGFVIFILWEIIFSFGDIPMISYPNVICNNENSRINMISLRPIGAMVCSICCLVVQPLVFAVSDFLGGTQSDERNAFFITAVIFALAGVLLYQITVPKNRIRQRYEIKSDNKHQYKYIFNNPLLKKIIVSGFLSSMSSLQGVILPALVTYYFSSKNSALTFLYTFLLGTGSFVGLMLSAILYRFFQENTEISKYIFSAILHLYRLIHLFLLYI